MSHRRAFVPTSRFFLLVPLLFVSCGGRSLDDGGVGAGGSTGGAVTTGGTGVGGTASGGSASGGASGGALSGGAPGSGGGVPPTGGSNGCEGARPPFCSGEDQFAPHNLIYLDVATGTCEVAAGQGCVQGVPLFNTLAECLGSCGGARPGTNACDADSDCVLHEASCCGSCGHADPFDFVALNESQAGPGCGGVLCGVCLPPPEEQNNFDYFRATCEDHVCTVTDLTQSVYAECTKDADCFLRDGTGCCSGCDGVGLVPLSSTTYLGDSCDAIDCALCDSPSNGNVYARCDPQTAHCVKLVEELLP